MGADEPTRVLCVKCKGGADVWRHSLALCSTHALELDRFLNEPHLSITDLELGWQAGLAQVEALSAELAREREDAKELRAELARARTLERVTP